MKKLFLLLLPALLVFAFGCSKANKAGDDIQSKKSAQLINTSPIAQQNYQVQAPKKQKEFYLHEKYLQSKGIYRNKKGYYDLSLKDLQKAAGIK